MFQTNNKDTRITLIEAGLVSLLLSTLNMLSFSRVFLEATTQKKFEKVTLFTRSGISIEINICCSSFIVVYCVYNENLKLCAGY